MTSPRVRKLQKREWEYWQQVVIELRRLGVEINDQDNLNQLLTNWVNARTDLWNEINLRDEE